MTLLALPAHGDQLAEASQLYERGTKAHERGDHLEAAKAFARADELVPDDAALEAALVAVLKTDAAVLGMQLASRTGRGPYMEKHDKLAVDVRARFGDRVGRIVVHCADCTIRIGGTKAPRGIATWVLAGEHDVHIDVDGRTEERKVAVEPTSIVTILPLATGGQPLPPPRPDEPDEPVAIDNSGPSPVWFFIGLGLTAGAGAGAIASAVHTDGLHDDFLAMPTEALSSEGQRAEIRTNVLYGLTGGLAALTAIVGVFIVDWSDDDDGTSWLTPRGVRITF